MFETRGLAATLGAVLTAAMCAGCGGSSSSDQTATFKQGLTPVVDQFANISRAIGSEVGKASSQSDAQIGSTFAGFAARWQTELSQLKTLKAPSDLAAPFNTLSSAATRAEADLNAIVGAARAHSGSAAQHASASMVADIAIAKAAATRITNKLGIK